MTLSEHSNQNLLTIDLIPAFTSPDDPLPQPGYIAFKMTWRGKQYGMVTAPLTREDCEGDNLCEAFDLMLEHVRRTFDALQASTPEQRAEAERQAIERSSDRHRRLLKPEA